MFSGQLIINYQNGMSMKIIDDLKNERMQIASRQMADMYARIDEAEDGTDVIMTEPVLPGTVLCSLPALPCATTSPQTTLLPSITPSSASASS